MDTPLTCQADGPITAPVLAQYLRQQGIERELARLIEVIAEGSVAVALRLAQGRLCGDPTAVVGTNESGDRQKALDMAAHEHFLALFRGVSVARVLSEEAEEVALLNPEGQFDIAMDPIDGSGSIGIGAPLGALFAIFPAGESFLRPGREMIAACYVSFGHSVDFGFSTGRGVAIAALDPVSGMYHVDAPEVRVKPATRTLAFNASNQRRWSAPLRSHIERLMQGAEGPCGKDYNMRWIAAAVGDLHRILRQGGLFLYPADSRPGYEAGFLRLAYEAFPIAFLIEQAGGLASDGAGAILDRVPEHIHDRVPLFFGSREEMLALQAALH
jgi:fructose-1,6-bisphosphatase I